MWEDCGSYVQKEMEYAWGEVTDDSLKQDSIIYQKISLCYKKGKQLRKMTEDLNIVRKKTGFNEGWEMSLPDSNNIQ